MESPTGGCCAAGVADQVPALPPGPGRGGAGHLHIRSSAAANQQQFQVKAVHEFILCLFIRVTFSFDGDV